ncbi:MAG TPA: RpiB/LacA/LacB family sugar-phosphate isomerase [Tepidisphaeraceae bacterium]|nr:RpiB/LacA/LacB family sugar-phosphate isomerase [Tepidisphaeraceae bacterium]
MKVAIACDHRGYEAKMKLLPTLQRLGHTVSDFGCDGSTSVDYPDVASPAAQAVANGDCEVGVLLEGSGIGMTIVANKFNGVRAVHAHDEFTARRSREHHHCNVLCIGADLLSDEQLRVIVEIFLSSSCEPGRHKRRIEKIRQIEAAQSPSAVQSTPANTPV